MKKTSILVGAAALVTVQAQAETVQEYAARCAQDLGLSEIPAYTCSDGALGESGENVRSVPASGLLRYSGSSNTLGVVTTDNPNVDAVFLCRGLQSSKAVFNGYILHNEITGNTCFFDAKNDKTPAAPSPNDTDAHEYWQSPDALDALATTCVDCHSTDPFVVPPGIVTQMKGLGLLRRSRNVLGPYHPVGRNVSGAAFYDWDIERWKMSDLLPPASGCVDGCHFGSINAFYTVDAGVAPGNDTGLLYLAFSESWMGPSPQGNPVPGYPASPELPASIGVWRPGNPAHFYFDHDGNHAWNTGDQWGQLGGTGDSPVVLRGADCTTHQKAEFGVSRPTMPSHGVNHWYITANNHWWDNNDSANTFAFHHGSPLSWGGVPASFRDGIFRVDYNSNRLREGDIDLHFGATGDVGVIGRWVRGMGYRMGVYRDGYWYLDENGNNQLDWGVEVGHQFGAATDIPFVGDFNGDGVDEIGTFRNGSWFVDTNNNFQWNGTAGGDSIYYFGQAGDIPVVAAGKWNCAW